MGHLPARISHYTPIHTTSSGHGSSMSTGAVVAIVVIFLVVAVIGFLVKASRR